ncbi:MGDG synthase family glycosyltransferase [Paenibacillus soyae]|uniref:Diacylglycerol glucosyltransferase n=1 Tax=Paenibacillus soyae TaxID=2969249 RepID=A0A9X2MPU3_9BACL|nr:glycosyltransferase [Paenibacillus soyae]MCR2804220.1 diacylglycerol glucosyltransferase [Paenibacillus soyae]
MLQQPHYRSPKLLIVYASYGEGHIQAAKALQEAYSDFGHDKQHIVTYDLMAESHPWINEMTRRFYQKSYTHLPYLYGWMYDITKPMKHNSLFGSWLHSFGRQKVRQLLAKEKPDAVVYTFPLFAPQELQRQGHRIPSYVVMTDFDLHCRWVHPGIDRYYVPTQDLRAELKQLGISHNKIKVSGIPLKKGFKEAKPSPELYVKYGLDSSKPTILIMAGAQGVMPHIQEMCENILSRSSVAQITLVCGHNDELKTAVDDSISGEHSSRIRTFGYVNEIHELMALSDSLVTKPGGITLAEAISAELPAFIYRPVPGQEKRNALYLQSKGAAFVASQLDTLVDRMLELVHDPLRLMNSRLHIRRLQPSANPSSATAAQTIILDIVSNLRIINHASLF